MRDINRAERLLSLFTSPDSAAGIVGDLNEERGQRGSLWFWRQVLGTALSLARGALFEAPWVVLGLVAMGFCVLVALTIAGNLPAAHVLNPTASAARSSPLVAALIILTFKSITWLSALLTGATLVAVSPRRGMAACLALCVLLELPRIAVLVAAWPQMPAGSMAMTWTFSQLTLLFLLLGGALLRRLWLRRQLRPA